ncbi:hypothetical protein [Stenotrophomonas rhizophila]|uniref:hypothetical protein n=1 Tax=Stenotrophomonas rhizophila TaxID=216778 RepID=UPI000ED202FE|nr:hypothetical protein [Stenotrophomonas rhizophila]HCQ47613.1 hypothetical protein [Achromobacter sp.]
MSSVPLSIPAVIDVDAEINYWRTQHTQGKLKLSSFGNYVPWVKFACNSLISKPHADDRERARTFKEHFDYQILPRLSEDEAREFVEQVWEHVYLTSQHDQNARPRLTARA